MRLTCPSFRDVFCQVGIIELIFLNLFFQFADLNNANLLDKLSKMVSCLSKVKFMLESDLGRINESLEMDSMKCLPLSRIHNFEEMEKLAKYLENWILFQVIKYECSQSLKLLNN